MLRTKPTQRRWQKQLRGGFRASPLCMQPVWIRCLSEGHPFTIRTCWASSPLFISLSLRLPLLVALFAFLVIIFMLWLTDFFRAQWLLFFFKRKFENVRSYNRSEGHPQKKLTNTDTREITIVRLPEEEEIKLFLIMHQTAGWWRGRRSVWAPDAPR